MYADGHRPVSQVPLPTATARADSSRHGTAMIVSRRTSTPESSTKNQDGTPGSGPAIPVEAAQTCPPSLRSWPTQVGWARKEEERRSVIREDRWKEVKKEAFVHVAYERNAKRLRT